jgi:transcriptional regulator with XRE-family HTH domain
MRKEPKSEDITLAKRITRVREEFAGGIDQGRFAEPLGVTRQAVVNWERGHGAGRASLKKIATAYNVSFDWLATGHGEPTPGQPTRDDQPPPQSTPVSELEKLKARLGEQFAKLMQADEQFLRTAVDAIEGILHALPPERSRIKRTKEKSSPIRT